MSDVLFGQEYLQELEGEIRATRKCLERIPENLYSWKPHEKSMTMGYLTLLVAEIPKWLTYIIEVGEIDFVSFSHFQLTNTAELVQHFDENIEGAKKALQNMSNDVLTKTFSLKNQGQVLYSSSVKENIVTTLNHWVHHRGQLTVYMRLNDIPVPSIYGPSADDRNF